MAAVAAVAVSLVALPAAADSPSSPPVGNAAPTTSTSTSTSSPTTTTTPPTTTTPTTTSPATTAPPTTTTTPALPEPPKDVAGQFIVTLKPGVDPDAMAQESETRGDKVDHVYHAAAHGFAGKLSSAEVARLQSDPRVERVEADQVVHVVDATQSNPPSWGLDRVDERAPDSTNSYTYPNTASNVTAYVIDTGIYAANTDFGGRVGVGRNFVTGEDPNNTNDCYGHGTHVAGTIGGTAYGVAKQINLVPVRVLNCNGSGSWSDVVAGLDWVTAQHVNDGLHPAVANLSLGGGYSQSVNDAVAKAVADGVVVAVAAGNDNNDACQTSPASEPSALTVGATDSADQRASFSNYGTCVDLFAPGVNITSDWIGATTATNTISGTSMATPHVAGVAALYLAGNLTPTLIANVTTGRVLDAGTGSPNKLLYVGTEACTPVSCPPPPPPPTPPANDMFASAQVIATTSGSATGTTTAATKESGEPNHVGYAGGHSIWYQFTAANGGTATIDTFGSAFDTLLAVYTGNTVNALTSVAANDDTSPGLQSRVQFAATAGTTYRVAIDGYGGASGGVTISWTLPAAGPPPPPPSGNTGWKPPTAQAADTGGDNNGYENSPTRALANDGKYAVDTNSGTGPGTDCTDVQKDRHRFYGYSLALPAGATVKGIEVQVRAKVDNVANSPQLCVQLSSDGGTTWTTKTTTSLTKNAATYTVGGTADTWGRSWGATDLGSGFRVRIVDVATSTARDFSLDVVSVRVTY